MKISSLLATTCLILFVAPATHAASSGSAFYGDAPDEHHPWAVHDPNRPQPKVVTPGTFSTPEQPGQPPSDAIVLFDGTDLSKWESAKDGSDAKWLVQDGFMQVAGSSGDIRTKEKFGDCQLHLEWATPAAVIMFSAPGPMEVAATIIWRRRFAFAKPMAASAIDCSF